jgi:hypothetical protein
MNALLDKLRRRATRARGAYDATCSVCTSRVRPFSDKTALACGHVFHTRCIRASFSRYKPRCPNCDAYIVNAYERALLTQRDRVTLDDPVTRVLLARVGDAYAMLGEAARMDRADLLMAIASVSDDAERLLARAIDDANVSVVTAIARARRLNWHSSIGGQTLLDRAMSRGDLAIVNVVLDSLNGDERAANAYSDATAPLETTIY